MFVGYYYDYISFYRYSFCFGENQLRYKKDTLHLNRLYVIKENLNE